MGKKLPIHVLNKQGKITAILTLHSDLTVVKVIEKSTAKDKRLNIKTSWSADSALEMMV